MRCAPTAIFFVLLLGPAAAVGQPATELDPIAAEEFRFLDYRHLPRIAGRRLVRVAGRECYQSGVRKYVEYEYGLLVEENDAAFVIFTIDLLTRRYPRHVPGHDRERTYESLDLEVEARQYLATREERRAKEASSGRVGPRHFHEDPREPFTPGFLHPFLDEPSRAVVLAWICARNGHEDTARELYALANRLRKTWDSDHRPTNGDLFSCESAAKTLLWDAMLTYGAGESARSEFQARLRYLVKSFDFDRRLPHVRGMVHMLTGMIEEDAEHAARVAPDPESTAPEARIADLIFALRDQRGSATTIPGECELQGPPADELVRIGLPAVPQLIEALHDPRLTRMIEDLRPFYFSHSVLRVGDAALRILERIARRQFLSRYEPTEGLLLDGRWLEARRAVEAWWHRARPRGEGD